MTQREPETERPIWSRDDLVRFAAHTHADVRSWAFRRLRLHHAETAAELALHALSDPNQDVVYAALDCLKPPYPPAVRQAVEACRVGEASQDVRRLAEEILAANEAPLAETFPPGPGEPEIDRLSAKPAELRRRAPELLASDEQRSVALFALERQRNGWATALILEHLDRIHGTEDFRFVWEVLRELGDVSALDVALAHHRAGERFIADAILFLHRLSGNERALPAAVLEDAARLADWTQALAVRMADPTTFGTFTSDDPVDLPLRCVRCRATGHYRVDGAVIHPDGARCFRDGWDGIALTRIVICKWCGAEDDYELTNLARAALAFRAAQHLRDRATGASGTSGVVVGEARLWDGTQVRRPSTAIAHLRSLAHAKPTSGEAWRRLGNFCERAGRLEEARSAWEQSVRVDEGELEAQYSIAKHHYDSNDDARCSPAIDEFFRRLSSNRERRPGARGAVAGVLELLRSGYRPGSVALHAMWEGGRSPKGDPVVNVSSIDLGRLERTDALTDFLSGDAMLVARITADVPTHSPTQLELLLAEKAPAAHTPRSPVVHSGSRVGRNDPCSCGSTKKYKKCCGR